MSFQIDLGGASTYTPYSGSGSSLLNHDGIFTFLIADAKEGESRSGNKTIELTLVCQDDDEKGQRLMKAIPVTGNRKDGKPNVHALLALFRSIYTAGGSTDDEATAKVQSMSGALDSTKVIETIKNKNCIADVTSRVYTRQDGTQGASSDANNFVTAGKLESARSIGAHRRALPAAVVAAASGGSQATAAASNGVNQSASDLDLV